MFGTRLVSEERYCAFIDILGFSSTVHELEQLPGPQRLDRLLSCLNFMAENSLNPPEQPHFSGPN